MNNPRISLCMIVKNEEDVIAHCLRSTRTAADEWIVVDTGSTDRTVEIAQNEGATVYSREWLNDFAASRNESIELATGEWILVLDADETLEEGQGEMLRQLVADAADADGFFVRIMNYIGTDSKQANSSVSASLRLFRNKPAYRYAGRIHEQIVQPILTAHPQARLIYSSLQLNHGGYLPEVVQKKNKVQRNLELLHKELENTDNESFHRYNLGIEYMRMGDFEHGLEQLRSSKAAADWTLTSFGHVVIIREAHCLQVLERWEEAIQLCEMAVQRLTDFPDLFFVLGRIYYHLHNWSAARNAFRQALAIGEAPPQYTSISGAGTYGACFHLGKTCEQLRDYDGAVQHYANALKLNPTLLSPFLRLIGLLAHLHDAEEVTAKLGQLFQLESAKTWWSIALSYYQLGLYEQAVAILRSREMPTEKKEDRSLLLLRCRFLIDGVLNEDEDTQEVQRAAPLNQTHTLQKSFYQALVQNDDKLAKLWLTRLEDRKNSSQKNTANYRSEKTLPDLPHVSITSFGNNPSAEVDAPSELILNFFAYLVQDQGKHVLPLDLPPSAYEAFWSELHFLYTLAVSEHLFALQAQVQAYWRSLLTLLPNPVERLKGRYQLIKTVHVRIYQIIQSGRDNLEYASIWNDVKLKLMTLIDDLLLEGAF
ncbi:MAG: tetratricopeptide repeat protein [Gorillibacterium sp.]|nr:tetratricopeptide repeat protein [Gorillibacterium sp.]